MKTIVTTLAATLLAVTPAFAEMEDYDSDGDAMLNDAEFGEAEGGKRFIDYDTDGSGDVSEEEFAAGEFNRYDRDGDGGVNDEEYARFEEDGDDGEEED
ncbi:hypothetical protein [Jannaschia marina]|uniref:hypothetical protein n=1 Tax=Jannaschia marina TaxID=2741674 RepID=UPI0015CD6137|nr:hypothetical protein [Jannaschia marina]